MSRSARTLPNHCQIGCYGSHSSHQPSPLPPFLKQPDCSNSPCFFRSRQTICLRTSTHLLISCAWPTASRPNSPKRTSITPGPQKSYAARIQSIVCSIISWLLPADDVFTVQSFDSSALGDGAVIGCDFVGEVVELGSGLTSLANGDISAVMVLGGKNHCRYDSGNGALVPPAGSSSMLVHTVSTA